MHKRDLLNFNAKNFCEDLHKSIQNFSPQDNGIINPNNLNVIINDSSKLSKLQLTTRWELASKPSERPPHT